MRDFRIIPLVLSLFAQTLAAQSPANNLTLSGTVVNDATGEPIPRALVTCSSTTPPDPELLKKFYEQRNDPAGPPLRGRPFGSTTNARTLTDATGAFRCEGMVAGGGNIEAQRPQFTRAYLHQEFPESKQGLIVRMVPLSAIEGVVADEDGVPLQGVNVILSQVAIEQGRKTFRQQRAIRTDEFGHYRCWNLPAGDFLVRATGRSGIAQLITDSTSPTAALEAPVATYFGGSASRTGATPLALGPGQTLPVNFRLRMQPTHRVAGTLTGASAAQPLTMELLSPAGERFDTRVNFNQSNGNFLLLDAPAGQYRLRVAQTVDNKQLFAFADVTISDQDITDLNLTLQPGPTIETKINCPRLESGGTPAPLQNRLAGCFRTLQLLDRTGKAVESIGLFEAQTFTLEPGSYQLSVSTAPARKLTSVRWQGRELSPDSRLEVQPNSASSTLELDLQTSKSGTISLSHSIPNFKEAIAAVLVPRLRGFESIQETRVDPQSPIEFFVSAGDYTVYVFRAGAVPEYTNPEILRTLSGIAVQIDADKEQKIELRSLSQ